MKTTSLSRRTMFSTLLGGGLIAISGIALTTQNAVAQANTPNNVKAEPRRPSAKRNKSARRNSEFGEQGGSGTIIARTKKRDPKLTR